MTPADLKSARKALGLTQAEMGEAVGRDRKTINRYELGKLPTPQVVWVAITSLIRDRQFELAEIRDRINQSQGRIGATHSEKRASDVDWVRWN
jgi:transcriptional regulator with XRE-family HTH domain